MFIDHKKKWVSTLNDQRMASPLIFSTLDLLANTTSQIEESLEGSQSGFVLVPQERDTWVGLSYLGCLGNGQSLPHGPMFASVQLNKPELSPFLHDNL